MVPLSPAATASNFRFYDNRQKYLLFVTTCSEKWVIAQRVAMELGNIHPRPPELRVFDAGTGDGTVLARTMHAVEAESAHIAADDGDGVILLRRSIEQGYRVPSNLPIDGHSFRRVEVLTGTLPTGRRKEKPLARSARLMDFRV